MAKGPPPRIAILGFSIECNAFAPPATRADFEGCVWLERDAITADARCPAPIALPETPGFYAAMDATGPWQPVPILLAMAEPNGPVEEALFAEMMTIWRKGLEAAKPLDGVYLCLHGAGLTTARQDPDGDLCAMVRAVVGPSVPIVATLDLHANVSQAMVDNPDVFVGYRTNPHMDMRERGEEAAVHMRALLRGTRTTKAFIRLPIVPPTVTMLTSADASDRPYGEMIDLGQRRAAETDCAGRIMNVSVMGGFAYADTAKNGLAVVVTAREGDADEARSLAAEIAELGWMNRARFRAKLTSLEDATALALATGADATRPAQCFADVADNPGGGGRGNTMWIIEAFLKAGVQGCLVGIINDAPLAAEAHRAGRGATFTARFNTAETNTFSKPLEAEARVIALSDGHVTGRRGIFAGRDMRLGPSAALAIGGLTIVVVSYRTQCADPAFFEMLGLDVGKARSVVVKSRGHFRGGFDEFFDNARITEVDAPGLTSPMLSRFTWKHLPRPVLPLDEGVTWQPPKP
ncbi:MAG: M81 family metallopeptidase [Acetobacteraceae bacterium]|jgi:microcystin degradation protein MlrC|nr:M81 family metallopeptidase [Acetobacteraceae bacterium]